MGTCGSGEGKRERCEGVVRGSLWHWQFTGVKQYKGWSRGSTSRADRHYEEASGGTRNCLGLQHQRGLRTQDCGGRKSDTSPAGNGLVSHHSHHYLSHRWLSRNRLLYRLQVTIRSHISHIAHIIISHIACSSMPASLGISHLHIKLYVCVCVCARVWRCRTGMRVCTCAYFEFVSVRKKERVEK